MKLPIQDCAVATAHATSIQLIWKTWSLLANRRFAYFCVLIERSVVIVIVCDGWIFDSIWMHARCDLMRASRLAVKRHRTIELFFLNNLPAASLFNLQVLSAWNINKIWMVLQRLYMLDNKIHQNACNLIISTGFGINFGCNLFEAPAIITINNNLVSITIVQIQLSNIWPILVRRSNNTDELLKANYDQIQILFFSKW